VHRYGLDVKILRAYRNILAIEELPFLEKWAKEVFAGHSSVFLMRLCEFPNLAVALLL
jgi:hypothetical protein